MEATRVQVQAAALLCCLLLAAAPQAALGNCRDECLAGCSGWSLICGLSCTSACLGEAGISSLNAAAPNNSAQAESDQEEVSVLRGLKPADGEGPKN